MKIYILVTILALMLLFTTGCKSNSEDYGDKKVITFWHSFVLSTIPALDSLIAKFESEHPDIKIKAQYIPTGDALIQKLITSIQSNTAPDISWLHADYMEDLVAADAIYQMKHFIDGENGLSEEELNQIYPALIQYASWRGTLYSLPMEATNLALIYNKDMFKEVGLDPNSPPKNWDELKSYAAKITKDKDGDGNFDRVGFFVPNYPAAGPHGNWMTWQFTSFIWQAGGYLITEDQSEVLYNQEPGVSALSLWNDIYQAERLDRYTHDYDIAFASQRLGMAMDGPWNLTRYKEIVKNFDYAFAPLPAGPAKKATVVGGEYLAIFKQSKNPDAAWEFIKWIIQPENQAEWAMTSGYLPVRRDVIEIPKFKKYLDDNPDFKVFVEQMDYAQAQRPIDHGGLQIYRHIADAIEQVYLTSVTPKEALDKAAEKSNLLLKQKRSEK